MDFFPPRSETNFSTAPIAADRYHGPDLRRAACSLTPACSIFAKICLTKYRLAPPRTWPELVDQAKLILAQERDAYLTGYSAQFKQYEGLVCNMMEFVMSNGAALWDEQTLQSTLASSRATEAVRFVRDQIIRTISHSRRAGLSGARIAGLFTQGKALFHRNWPYAWEVANDPQADRKSPAMSA